MKYIKYLALVAFSILAKFIGWFWYFAVVWFRGYARSVVQSYALDNGINIKRLMERHPSISTGTKGWILKDVHNVGAEGFVKYRPVSKLKYYLVVFLIWGWVDDDSNQDTFDAGHNQRFIDGDLKNSWQAKLWRKSLIKANEKSTFGNTFDLGDKRAEHPCFNFPSALIWNTRNTAYNFSYMFETTSNESQVFLFKFLGLSFGYLPDGEVDGTEYWTLVVIKNF